ncbi:MAG: hypothetical protein KIS91_00860 [Anaerolineae bacterium]|nr:hypothetical protein [Anaerolineae bacterium]
MSDETKFRPEDAVRALFGLGRGGMQRRRPVVADLPPLERALREYQSARLRRTHADLVASPEYGPATEFFLNDIYAPKDFSRRDADLLSMHDFLSRILPPQAIRVLTHAVEVSDLTNHLEREMVTNLEGMGVGDSVTSDEYAAAYRMGDYQQRVRQIDLILAVGRDLSRLTRLPLIGTTLRAARGPAHRLGWADLQDFLERGFGAWKVMKDPERFLQIIEAREKAINDTFFQRTETPPPVASL